jgi:KDO2-lipid IV(A) lauroyltransferase
MQHLIEYIIFECIGFVLRLLPLEYVQAAGGAVGEFLGATLGYRRSVAMDNLRNAFPEKSEEELEQIMRGSFRNVGISLFEFMYFPRLSAKDIKNLIVLDNAQAISEAHAAGKGIILLTAHFGNWELMAQSVPVVTGIPVSVIVKPQANRFVDRQVNIWRRQFGNRDVPMENSIRELLRALQERRAIGIVGDQTAAKESIRVSFFGREVPTYEGPAMFCLKTGAPMIQGVAIRQPDGKYKGHFVPVKSDDLKGYNKVNITELTKRHVAITEEIIRQYPDQWMWMHKRWKHVSPAATPLKPATL